MFGRRSNLLGCSGTAQGMWANLAVDAGNVGFVHAWNDHPNNNGVKPELPLIGGIRNHVNHPIGKDCISAESTDNYWVIIYIYHRSHLLKGTRNGYWPIGT